MAFSETPTYLGPFAVDDEGSVNFYNFLTPQVSVLASRPAFGNLNALAIVTDDANGVQLYTDSGSAWTARGLLVGTGAQTFAGVKTLTSPVINTGVSGTAGIVTGPAAALDNQIARFNGTGGKTIQSYTSGGPTISDLGVMALSVNFNLTAAFNGALEFRIENTLDGSGDHAQVYLKVGGTLPDPKVVFEIDGVTTWSIGINNNLSDALQIGNNADPGVETAISIATDQVVTFNQNTNVVESKDGTLTLLIENTLGGVNDHAQVHIKNGGGSTADAFTTYEISGVKTWSCGANNGGGDGFSISESNDLGSSERLRIQAGGIVRFLDGLQTDDGFAVKVGGTVAHSTPGTNLVTIINGTAPVGTITNAASFYVAAGEMQVIDAGGVVSQLSPHNPETGEWWFNSKDTRTGKVFRVHMERLVRKLEEQFQWGFIDEYIEKEAA